MKNVTIRLTSAIVVAGEILGPGALMELTEPEARDLLRRGRGVLATLPGAQEEESAGADANEAGSAPSPEGKKPRR